MTNKIKEKLENDLDFMKMIEEMKIFNGRKKRNKMSNILLNCRLLIASTYSNMNQFCSACNTKERIEKNYLPNLKEVDLEKVFEDFILNIQQIYKQLILTQKWLSYDILHSKPFLDATYWLISVIRKDHLSDPVAFDFMKYLEYFGKLEEEDGNFNRFQSHYRKNFYHKYWVVAKYYEQEYGVDMSSYFSEGKSLESNQLVIHSFEQLNRYHFNYQPTEIMIKDLLMQLQSGSYNLRPYYQREEVMDTALASKIIESILLNIDIPYILVYDKLVNNNYVTEVVDGQQRILAILGFLQKEFKNERGELEFSKKNGYALRDLRILTEFNNLKSSSSNEKDILPAYYLQQILNTTLYLSKAKESDNNHFSAVDHFVRLNKNICPIKENSYRMWELTADRRILEYEKQITMEFVGEILPKTNLKKSANTITMKLACLFYHQEFSEIKLNNFSNQKVNLWLKEFTHFKDKNLFHSEEKIEQMRITYFNSFDETKEFYLKLSDFLKLLKKTIRELLEIRHSGNIPLSNYYYLFCILGNISREDLMSNAMEIYEIIHHFFTEIRAKKLEHKVILRSLEFTVKQVSIFYSYSKKRDEFKSKLTSAIKTS